MWRVPLRDGRFCFMMSSIFFYPTSLDSEIDTQVYMCGFKPSSHQAPSLHKYLTDFVAPCQPVFGWWDSEEPSDASLQLAGHSVPFSEPELLGSAPVHKFITFKIKHLKIPDDSTAKQQKNTVYSETYCAECTECTEEYRMLHWVLILTLTRHNKYYLTEELQHMIS